MSEPQNLPADPTNQGTGLDDDLDTSISGALSIPSLHNVGTVHNSSNTIRPSLAAIANAGVTSVQSTTGKAAHSPSSTPPNTARNAARTANQQAAQTQKPSPANSVKLPSHTSANNANSTSNNTGGNVTGGIFASHTNVPNVVSGTTSQGLPPLKLPGISGDNVKDWHQILISVGKTHGEAVVNLANFIMARKYAENPIRATALAADMLENASQDFCENLNILVTDGWDQSLGALFSCARTL